MRRCRQEGSDDIVRTAYVSSLDVLNRAIRAYGTETQCVVLFEEMSELQKEVCKHWRGSDNIGAITEELADVHIMLEQLRMMMGIDVDSVCTACAGKIDRLDKRLNREDGDHLETERHGFSD